MVMLKLMGCDDIEHDLAVTTANERQHTLITSIPRISVTLHVFPIEKVPFGLALDLCIDPPLGDSKLSDSVQDRSNAGKAKTYATG